MAQHDGRWMLTQAGRDYAGVLRDGVLGRVNKLADETARKMRQQMETIKMANLDHILGARAARDLAELQKVVDSRIAQDASRITDLQIAREAIQASASGWATLAGTERPQDALRDRISELTSRALADRGPAAGNSISDSGRC